MKYVDPDGEWFHFAIGAILGGVVNATISAYDQYKENGKVDFSTTAIAFGAGAVSGALAASGVGASWTSSRECRNFRNCIYC